MRRDRRAESRSTNQVRTTTNNSQNTIKSHENVLKPKKNGQGKTRHSMYIYSYYSNLRNNFIG